ncbi:MAG: VOC family protein [Sporolactobacillus sp.]
MINDYDNFFLGVDDLTEAKQYYHNTLGLPVKFDFASKGMIAFRVGRHEPAIILKDKKHFKDVKPSCWFVADNVNDTYRVLHEKGVQFLSAPFPIATGLAVEFEDPFGNRFGVADYTKNDEM